MAKDEKYTGKIHIRGFKLWRTVLLNYLQKNLSSTGPRRSYNFYGDTKALYSERDRVVYLYTIDGFPAEMPISYTDELRQVAQGSVKISFIKTFDRYKIDWNSPAVRSKLNTWRQMDSEAEDVDAFNYRENINQMDSSAWRSRSLVYLSDAELRRRRKLFSTRTMVVVSGVRGDEFDKTNTELVSLAKGLNIKLERVTSDIESYLNIFSPFMLESSPKINRLSGTSVVTDELVSRFNTYDQGKVGSEGMYWGTDIFSGLPVLKKAKRTAVDAENWLITAETGGGKSFFVKTLLLQLLAEPRFTGTIMDIEGFEYLEIADFVGSSEEVVVLNMAEGQGSYFDPVEIMVTGDYDLDKDMFSISKSFTLSLYKTLLGDAAEDSWADIIINDAVAKTYADKGVTVDMQTWGNSSGLTLYSIYRNLKELYVNENRGIGATQEELSAYRENINYKNALDLVIAKTSRYFEPMERGGTRADVFQKRVTVEQIRNAKLVICSFGMAGKAANTVDPVQMGLTQLYAANISHLRSLFSQSKGIFNFKLWEEFQRWGSFPDSEKTINTALTGGRKLGDINMIVTNKVSELLSSDKFGVFENTTSFAIGAIGDAKVREELAQRLSIESLLGELNDLVLSKGSTESFNSDSETIAEVGSIYEKSFLVHLDKSVTSLSRMELPVELSHSRLFRTGVVLEED